jgi:hypothetical protein
MRAFAGFLLVASFVAVGEEGANRKDELFAAWQKTQGSVRSLVVEFTLEVRDVLPGNWQKADGTFCLIRTPENRVFASYRFPDLNDFWQGAPKQVSGLLNNETVYLLNHHEQTARRFELTHGELLPFLEAYVNPFVQFLDQKLAEEQCHVEVVTQDEWYTYLSVKPKQRKRTFWFADQFHEGRIVLMNKDSECVPQNMPRQLWFTNRFQEYTFEIKKWNLNSANAPRLAEFTKPENRPGWRVYTVYDRKNARSAD